MSLRVPRESGECRPVSAAIAAIRRQILRNRQMAVEVNLTSNAHLEVAVNALHY